jgi:hypothetical protein
MEWAFLLFVVMNRRLICQKWAAKSEQPVAKSGLGSTTIANYFAVCAKYGLVVGVSRVHIGHVRVLTRRCAIFYNV